MNSDILYSFTQPIYVATGRSFLNETKEIIVKSQELYDLSVSSRKFVQEKIMRNSQRDWSNQQLIEKLVSKYPDDPGDEEEYLVPLEYLSSVEEMDIEENSSPNEQHNDNFEQLNAQISSEYHMENSDPIRNYSVENQFTPLHQASMSKNIRENNYQTPSYNIKKMSSDFHFFSPQSSITTTPLIQISQFQQQIDKDISKNHTSLSQKIEVEDETSANISPFASEHPKSPPISLPTAEGTVQKESIEMDIEPNPSNLIQNQIEQQTFPFSSSMQQPSTSAESVTNAQMDVIQPESITSSSTITSDTSLPPSFSSSAVSLQTSEPASSSASSSISPISESTIGTSPVHNQLLNLTPSPSNSHIVRSSQLIRSSSHQNPSSNIKTSPSPSSISKLYQPRYHVESAGALTGSASNQSRIPSLTRNPTSSKRLSASPPSFVIPSSSRIPSPSARYTSPTSAFHPFSSPLSQSSSASRISHASPTEPNVVIHRSTSSSLSTPEPTRLHLMQSFSDPSLQQNSSTQDTLQPSSYSSSSSSSSSIHSIESPTATPLNQPHTFHQSKLQKPSVHSPSTLSPFASPISALKPPARSSHTASWMIKKNIQPLSQFTSKMPKPKYSSHQKH
ncbi:uncharacterized protein MONOS_6803 [Monocercomonoides exilis]|uniref:uncharacterized protein n=1 Tax=Monocercomonoides exilis TaxID=2049356 RepID=UPI003559DE29|nr:hypothetical protein MONOS_6803 [Monocercomonoides exilis]|eukprot:MONOS_6803.1-p1 / transcript=MONOS_6803.1 / gene=MONOS_6803 / organism=Monocercomonoides_exilis_PA203 / gene_product=unspecified product / transcript_product=unspecified product / location=Mono_scaffold00221:70188-72165(+) / protein_length=620 / sequence_SO=supercontig / SO=protein_coding / is_pseudo=false